MKMTLMKMRFGMKGTGSDCALNGRGRVRPGPAAEPVDDVRWERVARLKAQIESGTYVVSSEALAERLMEHMLRGGSHGRFDDEL
jgi:hypothetical protein